MIYYLINIRNYAIFRRIERLARKAYYYLRLSLFSDRSTKIRQFFSFIT